MIVKLEDVFNVKLLLGSDFSDAQNLMIYLYGNRESLQEMECYGC